MWYPYIVNTGIDYLKEFWNIKYQGQNILKKFNSLRQGLICKDGQVNDLF